MLKVVISTLTSPVHSAALAAASLLSLQMCLPAQAHTVKLGALTPSGVIVGAVQSKAAVNLQESDDSDYVSGWVVPDSRQEVASERGDEVTGAVVSDSKSKDYTGAKTLQI